MKGLRVKLPQWVPAPLLPPRTLYFPISLHLSPPELALMYFSEHVWGTNCLLGRGRSDYEMLRASGDCIHNLGALQSVEMGEMRGDEEEPATDCWLGRTSRVGGTNKVEKTQGGECGKKEDIQMHRALLMGE